MKMKKRILSLAVILAVGLASCSSTPKDEVSPVLNGVSNNLAVEAQSEINLLEGISAVDDVDGDITSSIAITVMPELSVTDGKVTPIDSGDYEVKYSVSDKAGNVAEAFSTLTVSPKAAPKYEYKKFEFKDAETNGYNAFIHEAVKGSAGLKNGNYEINITESDNEAWHVKFENTLKTTKGTDYEVIYKFNSTVAGKVKTDGATEHDIVVGYNEISHKFTASGEEQYIELQLGMLQGPYTITMSAVKVVSMVGEDVYTDVLTDYKFNTEGLVSTILYEESEGNVEATETEAVFNITKGPKGNNLWETKVNVKAQYDLVKGSKYRIALDVEAQNAQTDIEVLFNDGDNEKGIGALYGQSFEAGQKKTFEIIVTPESDKNNVNITLQCGKLSEALGSQTLKLSNLTIQTVTGDKEVHEEETVFTPEGFGTYNDAASAEGYLYTEGGKLVYDMKKIGLTDWHNKLYIPKLELEAGKIYTIEFKAKADKEITCAFFLNPVGKWDPRINEQVKFTTTQTTYEYKTPSFAADITFEVLWQFGSEAASKLGGAKIEITELVIYAQDVEF